MGYKNWTLVRKLSRAMKKITFLLNFQAHRWRIASILASNRNRSRSFSFNDRTGLRDFTDQNCGLKCFQRTRSYITSGKSYNYENEDVDTRAERFISNFHQQLRYERQISLDLRYCNRNSFNE